MEILGIDPGVSGGISRLSTRFPLRAWKMPETERDIYELLRDFSTTQTVAYIEKVSVMPTKEGGWGRASTLWKFGQHYGGLRMALIALDIPFYAVAPGIWQKVMGCLSKGDKNVTKARAQEIFPSIKITHALADALLMGAYGWQKQCGLPYSSTEENALRG